MGALAFVGFMCLALQVGRRVILPVCEFRLVVLLRPLVRCPQLWPFDDAFQRANSKFCWGLLLDVHWYKKQVVVTLFY